MTDFRNRIIEQRIVDASELHPHPLNPRRHPETQKRAVAGLLGEVGIVDSLTVYESAAYGGMVVLDGHLRQEMGGQWPVNVLDVTDEEAELILATFDFSTSLAEFDGAALADLLGRVEMTPVEDAGVQALLMQMAAEHVPEPVRTDVDAEPQIDRAEELAEKWQTEPGQIWRIAQHFVICGDCREPETWQRLLAAAGVDVVNGVFTSPPYAEQRKEQYGGTPADQYVDWWEAVQANVKANLADDGSFFVNIKPHCEDGQRVLYVCDLVCAMVRRWEWRYVEELSWRNLSPAPGDWPERFKNGFEPIYQFAMAKTKFNPGNVSIVKDTAWSGDGGMNHTAYGKEAGKGKMHTGLVRPPNVIDAASSGSETLGQAAAFPVALPDFFVRAYSDRGDVWCDPFLGSGTTIVAAHQNGRVGVGMEMLPKYLGVILERLMTVTQRQPVLLEAA